MFVRVAVNIPSNKTFSYAVPERLKAEIAVGKRVLVPFGRKQITGYLLECLPEAIAENIRDINDVLDSEPLFGEEDLAFYRWVSDYYLYPLGKTLAEILPGGINLRSQTVVQPTPKGMTAGDDGLSTIQVQLLKVLRHYPAGLSRERLEREVGRKNVVRWVTALEAKGFVAVSDSIRKPAVSLKKEKIVRLTPAPSASVRLTERQRQVVEYLEHKGETPFQAIGQIFKNAASVIGSLEKKGLISIHEREAFRRPDGDARIGLHAGAVVLNADQQGALREIKKAIAGRRYLPFLLHGVTGSGKTEVYLQAIAEILKGGGSAICLAPEIALTPQLFSRFRDRFPDREIGLLHSGVSESARYDQWRRIRNGDIRIVIGARSALFAPVRDLRLIIVDEEHDGSYKQDDRMRYNARDLAVVRAKQQSAVVVLGTATPSVQSYFNSREKRYRYLHLPQRVEDRPLPAVEIVDMKAQHDEKGRPPILSHPLRLALSQTLEAHQQALLFLNRRGFNTFLFCPDCGHVFQCLNCSVSMNLHAAEGKLKCHYCNLAMDVPRQCPTCRGERIQSYGVGTEKLESEVQQAFPAARVARMDSDTTASHGAHGRLLKGLEKREIDVLVGTQMITKGHDFPHVTLVGVISADTIMNMPDFRAAEKTFQILTQVSGRGGRGDLPGRVVIQTFNPLHYAIRRAKDHDYEGFYQDERPIRESLSYPPFSRMINLHLSALDRELGKKGIGQVAEFAERRRREDPAMAGIAIIGPAEAPIARIKGRYRWQLLLMGKNSRAMHQLAGDILDQVRLHGFDIKADIDPMNFM